jgi:hypothetical protein
MKPSKSKALERCHKMIQEWYGPSKGAGKIEVPKKLHGIWDVRKMYWVNHYIL